MGKNIPVQSCKFKHIANNEKEECMRKIAPFIFIFVLACFNIAILGQVANHIVIAETYGGGGNNESHWANDYIILYNPTASNTDISTWSVQYAAYNSLTWHVTNLNSTITSGSYYSIQEAGGSSGDMAPLPFVPNVIGTISISATKGKVALVNNQIALTVSDPTSDPNVIDFIGYGLANAFEGSGAAPAPNNTSSVRRKDNNGNNTYGTNGSGWDTNDNSADTYKETDIINNPPLPVELTSFSASIADDAVKLNWRTETEVNNYGFDVERATILSLPDGGRNSGWKKIGFVEGHGNSNSPKRYSFVDNDISSGRYAYRLKQIDNDGSFEYSKVIEIDLGLPLQYELSQNYPNPFNPSTTIKYQIPKAGNVKLTVFNILGEVVSVLIDRYEETGVYSISFNASTLKSGIYFYKLESANFIQVKKMSLIK